MKLELTHNIEPEVLLMRDLKEDDIAVILSGFYEGTVIKIVKIEGRLFAIPLNYKSYWDNVDKNITEVRKLKVGETLTITEG